MKIDIYPISLGFDRTYLLRGQGVVMIDAGVPRKGQAFLEGLRKTPITPGSIRLLILTHGHWDHIGSAKDIRELTGARIAMHGREKDCLEKSLKPLPPPVTPAAAIFMAIMKRFMPFIKIPPAAVDIVLGDEDFPLDDFGIAGRVVYTPGHSPGSVSVLMDTGEAFVGDSAMNAFPLRLRPGLPVFAEDMQGVRDSWKRLLDCGAKVVYPAHGSPFPAEKMRRFLDQPPHR